jgi:hypothetical protein
MTLQITRPTYELQFTNNSLICMLLYIHGFHFSEYLLFMGVMFLQTHSSFKMMKVEKEGNNNKKRGGGKMARHRKLNFRNYSC